MDGNLFGWFLGWVCLSGCCLVLSWISLYIGINRTLFFSIFVLLMLIMCTQSCVHQVNFVMSRTFVEFLGVPTMEQSSLGISHYILFSKCWMHFRTIFLSKLKCAKQFCSTHWPSCPCPRWSRNSYRADIFSASEEKFLYLLWVTLDVICGSVVMQFMILPRIWHRNWWTFIGVNTNFPDLSWLILTISWNKSLSPAKRVQQNLEQHICICILWLRGEWALCLGGIPCSWTGK